MSIERFLRELASVTVGYGRLLEDLANEINSGYFNPRDLTLAESYAFHKELNRLIHLAEAEHMDFSPHTTQDRVRSRLGYLDKQRDELVAQLGPEETQRRLREEVPILVDAYCSKVRVIRKTWAEMTVEEFEEFQQDDKMSDLETLALRDSVSLLLPLLSESAEQSALVQDVAKADATLRFHGAQMFGPLLRNGSIQQLRAAQFQPNDRWWWYLDEIDGD